MECSGALETVMLLVQLASPGPSQNEFQAQARARFSLYGNHPAVRETAALMERGFGYQELALLSTFLSPAPYFLINDSPELRDLAERLPGAPTSFNLDRLHGYSKLVREFYWDTRMGQFLRSSLASYQQAVRQAVPTEAPPGAKVVPSLLAPTPRIEFKRRTPRPATYWVLGN